MTYSLTVAALAIVIGVSMAFWPQRRADAVARRIAEGDDRYFEEQRVYKARPWLGNPVSIRRRGIVLIVLGMLLLAIWGAGQLNSAL